MPVSDCLRNFGRNWRQTKQEIEQLRTEAARGERLGLGLSIWHGIVQYHHGQIRVESEPCRGSTFTVLLPVEEENRVKTALEISFSKQFELDLFQAIRSPAVNTLSYRGSSPTA